MKKWFGYTGGNPLLSTSYFETDIQLEFAIGRNIAGIYAKGNGPQPDELSTKLKKHISTALATGVSQPDVSQETLVFMKY